MDSYGIGQSISSWYGVAIMSTLLVMSLYLVALAVVRFYFFRNANLSARKLLLELQKALTSGDAEAIKLLQGQRASDAPARILISTALANKHLNEADMKELLDITRVRQRERLERGLPSFGTLAAISPFLGLLGTVMGIIEAFRNLALSGAAGPNVVASGVAAALWTTVAGLVVAIPATVLFNIFNKRARSGSLEMEMINREILLLMRHFSLEGKKK